MADIFTDEELEAAIETIKRHNRLRNSQFTACHKEIKRLREELLRYCAPSDEPTELERLLAWCSDERCKLGGVDGYDYRSGEEFGIRRVEIQIEKALAKCRPSGSLLHDKRQGV
jgi:hypothetical protein